MYPTTQTLNETPPSAGSNTSATTAASSLTIQSIAPNVVSDVFAKDSHQLLMAHLYNYLKQVGLHESARSLLSESSNVPNNVKNNSPQQGVTDTQMVINASSSTDPFLLEWWTLLWTVQSNMNPALNQLFHKINDPQQLQQQFLHQQQQLQQQFLHQQQHQQHQQQLQFSLQQGSQGRLQPMNKLPLQQQQLHSQSQSQLSQSQLSQQQISQQQQIQHQQQQIQQQQFVQQRLLAQQQQLQAQQAVLAAQDQTPGQNVGNVGNLNPQRAGSISSASSGVVPISANANSNANRMLPPNSAGSAPPPKNGNLHQYQQQLRLQQIKLQFQQQAQLLQQQQQRQQGQSGMAAVAQTPGQASTAGAGVSGNVAQLQSPLLVNGQQSQSIPKPQGNVNDINDYQANLLRMENQNNLQKKQFLMKQQHQQQLAPTSQFSINSPLQQSQMPNSSNSNGSNIDNGVMQLQQQQQQMMFQMMQQQQQQQLHPSMQFPLQNGNMLMMGNEESLLSGGNSRATSAVGLANGNGASNGRNMNSMLDAATTAILSNSGKEQSGANGNTNGSSDNIFMNQQQLQLNLQYQLQQDRPKFVQQQGPVNGAETLGGQINGIVKEPTGGSGLIETDWLSSMGSGPGFP